MISSYIDEIVIKNALNGLCYALENKDFSDIFSEKIVNSGVLVNYINKYFNDEYKGIISKTIYYFFGVIGNISCNKPKFSEYLIKIKAIDIVIECIDNYYLFGYLEHNLVFERALWVLSNTVSDSPSNSLFLANSPTMMKLFEILKQPRLNPNISYEILYCIFGSLHAEEPAISIEYFKLGIINICYELLKSDKMKVLEVTCDCLCLLVMQGFSFMQSGVHKINFFLEEFVKLGGFDVLTDSILKINAPKDNRIYLNLLQLEKWSKNYLEDN